MALGYMVIMMGILILAGILLQFFLYKTGDELTFILNMIFGIIISYLVFTSLPSNYTAQKVLSLAWGFFGIIALILRLRTEEKLIPKLIMSISVIGGLIHLIV